MAAEAAAFAAFTRSDSGTVALKAPPVVLAQPIGWKAAASLDCLLRPAGGFVEEWAWLAGPGTAGFWKLLEPA